MKYLTLLLLGLLVLLPSSVQAATLSLSPSTGTFNRGCPFDIRIELDTKGKDTDGTDAVLIYDSSKLVTSPATIQNGTIYPDYPGNSVDSSSGNIAISGLASLTKPFNGKGTFATINFTVSPTAAPGPTQVKFLFDPNDKANTKDSNVVEKNTIADLLDLVVDGNYTIGTGSCNGASSPPIPAGRGGVIATGSGGLIATPTATPFRNLPDAGFFDQTVNLTVAGIVLVIIGVFGLALL